jgi:GTP cyclohydrolase I
MDIRKIERGVKLILEGVGEDPLRPGIRATPHRVARMLAGNWPASGAGD